MNRPSQPEARALAHRVTLNPWVLFCVPGVLFLAAFFLYPLAFMVVQSLRPAAANYGILVGSPVYIRSFGTTFEISALVTALTLLLGYPYAYVMTCVRPRWTAVLAVVVLLPFWSSMLVRTYAWQIWLDDTGVINTVLGDLHLIASPLPLIRTTLGVCIGMTQVLMPYMVLPLYAAMRRIDPDLPRAAASLGARPTRAFVKVFLPLSSPGIYAGCILVFILGLGFYLAPVLLGDPQDVTVSQLIATQVNQLLNFGTGSAIGVVLLLATLTVLGIGSRFVRLDELFSYGGD